MTSPHFFLFPLFEPLPETIRINGSDYDTLKILQCLEQITGQKIITKYNNRLIRKWLNVTLEFGVIPPKKIGEPLIIIGKNESYKIWQ